MAEKDVVSWTFGNWDASIHSIPDQLKRLATAKKTDTTPSSVDKEKKEGIFPGSGKSPYTTTLNTCNCGDFFRRRLPCKHIYRLAMECGDIPSSFSAGLNKNLQLSLQEAVAEVENYDDRCQLFFKNILLLLMNPECSSTDAYITDDLQAILMCPLFAIKPCGAVSVLNDMRKKDITDLLSKLNIVDENKLKKADLINWCVENHPNISQYLPKKYSISCASNFTKAVRRTYLYLKRKFDWTEELVFDRDDHPLTLEYPYGAKSAAELLDSYAYNEDGLCLYFFPKDEITALLTMYGHNRCLNGFAPKIKTPT